MWLVAAMPDDPETLHYKRSHFATQLPTAFLYSASHAWAARQADGSWRVGLTRFATRMLGEMVDHGFAVPVGAPVHPGQIIGWLEGFKAISDLYCIAEGEFGGGNAALLEQITLVNQDPHGEGWLYGLRGTPDPKCMDVYAYRDLLDQTIDRLMAKRAAESGNDRVEG